MLASRMEFVVVQFGSWVFSFHDQFVTVDDQRELIVSFVCALDLSHLFFWNPDNGHECWEMNLSCVI